MTENEKQERRETCSISNFLALFGSSWKSLKEFLLTVHTEIKHLIYLTTYCIKR